MRSLASTLPVVVAKHGAVLPVITGHFPAISQVEIISLQQVSTNSSIEEHFPVSESQKTFTATTSFTQENCSNDKIKVNKISVIDKNQKTFCHDPTDTSTISPQATKVASFSSTSSFSQNDVPVVTAVYTNHSCPVPVSPSTVSRVSSLPPATSAIAVSKVSPVLSPHAQIWIPSETTKVLNLDVLYPPGRNLEGIEYKLSDEAYVALELGEKVSQDFELPGEALPDLENSVKLPDLKLALPNGSCFVDKILPPSATATTEDKNFPTAYFINLHKMVRDSGTYNFAGARIELPHSKLNIPLFHQYLKEYDDREICQFLQFGFPLGLAEEIFLEPSLKNHKSSYCFYTYIDKFLHKEVSHYGISGPLPQPPFNPTMLSPMMTSPKKIMSRRPVFDASWGDWSLNENTPVKSYMGGNYAFTFPTVLDLGDLIVKKGPGCLLWKRDLSRWFLQLPVDPADYDKLGFVWRGQFWMFVSYVWGCRHAGYAGQRVSSAILFILRKLGLTQESLEEFCAMVYMDDFAGCENGQRAFIAFETLGKLLAELGVQESVDKASSPSTKMRFLGVEFDTVSMAMRIDSDKLKEITTLSKIWARKTVATKQELQSILGKLIWVSKVVRFSRCFVARIISILKGLRSQKQKVTLSLESRKDFLWWSEFLPVFNGVELLVPNTVFCSVIGDATLQGGGSWNEKEKEFFSRPFPLHLKSHKIYIHIKEFLVAIIATKLWGHLWEGKRVAIYCDNEAVVKTMVYQKPQDPELQKCLREILFYACKFHFQPVFLRITTDDNDIADFISRNHDSDAITAKFTSRGLNNMRQIPVDDELFDYVADW